MTIPFKLRGWHRRLGGNWFLATRATDSKYMTIYHWLCKEDHMGFAQGGFCGVCHERVPAGILRRACFFATLAKRRLWGFEPDQVTLKQWQKRIHER